MSKPFSVSRLHRSALLGLALLGTAAVADAAPTIGRIIPGGIRQTIPAVGQQTVPAVNQMAQLVVPTLKLNLAPELNNYLVGVKAKASPSLFASSFTLKDGIPAFVLGDGSVRLLMPSTGNENTAASLGNANAPIPDELKAASPYINKQLKLGIVNPNIINLTPSWKLSTGVDQRSLMTPIKDQGSRGTCVAFATNAALESFPSIPDDLSEEYSYHMSLQKDGKQFCYNGGTYLDSMRTILANGTVQESDWPYSYSIPPCNEAVPAGATSAAKYKITDSQWIANNGLTGASIKNPDYLETILDSGKKIVIATQVAWYGQHNNDVIDVVIDPYTNQPAASRGNHAMVIVGYNRPQQYFIVRNSWGTGFGHDGYAYLSYDYIRTYTYEGYYIKNISPAYVPGKPSQVFQLNKVYSMP